MTSLYSRNSSSAGPRESEMLGEDHALVSLLRPN